MAHPDLDELLNNLLPFAQEMLAKHGEFFPFGATVASDGEVRLNAAEPDDDSDSLKMIDQLERGFGCEAAQGAIRAAAICLDVRVALPKDGRKTDAVCVRAEHENGECPEVYLPYQKSSTGHLTYGELFAVPGRAKIFSGA